MVEYAQEQLLTNVALRMRLNCCQMLAV